MEERNYKLYVHISPNGKRYYGITCRKRVQDRWKNGKGYYPNKHFTNAINKYAWENFEHIILFDNLTKEEACLLEQCYIALYNTTNSKYGYNNTLGGEHGLASEQTKKRLSEAHKGITLAEETKKKMSESRKGEKHWNYGKQLTEEHKKNLSESHKGQVPWNKGKQLPEEYKKKLSESHKGKQLTEEHKKKIGEANKGKNNPNYGKQFTEEHRKKMSEAKKGKNNVTSKPILMFNKSGEFIKRFDCTADANEYLGKDRNNNNISQCARGKQNTAYDYKWIYEEDYIKEQEQAI